MKSTYLCSLDDRVHSFPSAIFLQETHAKHETNTNMQNACYIVLVYFHVQLTYYKHNVYWMLHHAQHLEELLTLQRWLNSGNTSTLSQPGIQ